MQNEIHAKKTAKAEIFATLSEFYKIPTEQFFAELKSGSLEQRLKKNFEIADYNYPDISLNDSFKDFIEFKQNYLNCFVGIVQPFAPPIESVYKVWTTDPTAEMGMAKEKGYVFGDSAIHIRHLFDYYQLEIPEEFEYMPDHLTLLLEFLVFILQRNSGNELQQLLTDHFDWLDDFVEELKKIDDSSFYAGVTKIVIEAINSELRNLRNK